MGVQVKGIWILGYSTSHFQITGTRQMCVFRSFGNYLVIYEVRVNEGYHDANTLLVPTGAVLEDAQEGKEGVPSDLATYTITRVQLEAFRGLLPARNRACFSSR